MATCGRFARSTQPDMSDVIMITAPTRPRIPTNISVVMPFAGPSRLPPRNPSLGAGTIHTSRRARRSAQDRSNWS
jgi:hypothetical protein